MYEAYSDYESMINMAEEIVTRCALAVHGKLTIDYQVICSLTLNHPAGLCCVIKIASP